MSSLIIHQKENQTKNLVLFLLFCTIAIMFKVLFNSVIITDELIREDFTGANFNSWLALQRQWQLIGYILVPLVGIKLLIIYKLGLITSSLHKFQIEKVHLLAVIVKSEFVYLIGLVFRIVWFLGSNNYTLGDVENFVPFSIMHLFDESSYGSIFDRITYSYFIEKFTLVEILYVLTFYRLMRNQYDHFVTIRLLLIPYLILFFINGALRVLLMIII